MWALAPNGLYHLAAAEPSKPGKYAIGTLYTPVGITGGIVGVEHSKLGYLVVTAHGNEKHYLHLLRLPSRGR